MEETSVWTKICNAYDIAFIQADPRTYHWFLIPSHWPMLAIIFTYLTIVFFGPNYMRNREPYKLNKILPVFNIVQVGLSGYMFKEFLISAVLGKYYFTCAPFEFKDDPVSMRMASVIWVFFLSKLLDLVDTFFFILKKKNSNITFLHVFHHSTMVMNTWLTVRHMAGGSSYMVGLLNSFVHIFMYSYYFLAALGPSIQKYLWWKKYLTQLQLIQFCTFIVHMIINVYTRCPGTLWLQLYIVFYSIIMIVLFMNFYLRSYSKRKTLRAEMTTSKTK